MKQILNIQNLYIGYKQAIQKDISASLYPGQFICLIGPNGIGKSTLLKTISGIIAPLKGHINIDDKALKDLNHKSLSRLISLVLTDHIESYHLKAIDIISMGRYPHTGFWGKLSNNDQEIIEKVIHQIGIQPLSQRYFSELSDGEKQKVMIAKALVQEAPLMLLDEPTAFLDFPTKAGLLVLLRKLAKQNQMGIILSTHDIELALKTADQIWLLQNKDNLIKGMPEDLVLQGHIKKVFYNKEMQFNETTGHFEKMSKEKYAVNLIGESKEMYWLSKALQRNEIGTSRDAEISISYTDRFLLQSNSQRQTEHSTIEDVLCTLNQSL